MGVERFPGNLSKEWNDLRKRWDIWGVDRDGILRKSRIKKENFLDSSLVPKVVC